MSNDRHNPDIARTMGSAIARDPVEDARRDEERRTADDRRPSDDRPTPIFADGETDGYRTRWDAIQTGFVDEPRKAVHEADALVAVVRRAPRIFATPWFISGRSSMSWSAPIVATSGGHHEQRPTHPGHYAEDGIGGGA